MHDAGIIISLPQSVGSRLLSNLTWIEMEVWVHSDIAVSVCSIVLMIETNSMPKLVDYRTEVHTVCTKTKTLSSWAIV